MRYHHWRKIGCIRGGDLGFLFFLYVTEINIYKLFWCFIRLENTNIVLEYLRNNLVWKLVDNKFLLFMQVSVCHKEEGKLSVGHEISTATPHANKCIGRKWDQTESCRYQQCVCRCTNWEKPVRSFFFLLSDAVSYNIVCKSCHVSLKVVKSSSILSVFKKSTKWYSIYV